MNEPSPHGVPKYEAWLVRLETHRANYVRRFPLYRRFFIGLALAGLVCFARSLWFGVAASFCTLLVSVCGYWMVHVRLWELQAEIANVRLELDRMRGS